MVDALFVISASPETILKRVKIDKAKNNHQRNLLPANLTDDKKLLLIEKFLNITLDKAKKISKKYNLPLFNIDNNKDGFNNVIKEFIKCESNIS